MSFPTAVSSAAQTSVARSLASWAHAFRPTEDDLSLADRALKDTLGAALAARDHPLAGIVSGLPDAARWAAMAHVLDFDDLHTDTTTHISVVAVPATLAAGGDARAYLAGAGVFARLAAKFGWGHYAAGWHITCTAGALAAAVAAGVALGLSEEQLATSIALAIPAAGGVQEVFGTHGKSLQVGFAADAGVRAAQLARAGATASPAAVESWMRKLGGNPEAHPLPDMPGVPGGLAIKMFPCCYAMQRPIVALRELKARLGGINTGEICEITVTSPAGTIHPLIYDAPTTGLEGKFSLQYSVATALLDHYPDFDAFTDKAVQRPEAKSLMSKVEVVGQEVENDNLLDGEVVIHLTIADGTTHRTSLSLPPGAPDLPPTAKELSDKLASCGSDVPGLLENVMWAGGAKLLARSF